MFNRFFASSRYTKASLCFASLLAVVCLLHSPSKADDEEGLNPVNPALEIKDPLQALKPPPTADDLDKSLSAVPTAPVTVQKRDRPRTDLPMEDYTEYYEKKVFAVPEARPGQTLTYFWKEPASYHPKDKRYPLVVILHDNKGIAQAAETLIKKDMRKNFPAYIAVPVLPTGQIWAFPSKFPDDETLAPNLRKPQGLPDTVKLVEDLMKDNEIDPARVYVVGCDEGAFGVFGAASRNADVFTAGVPINGGWTVKEAPKMTNFPLFVMHGEKDKKFTPGLSRNVAYYIQQFGGRKVSFIQVPNLAHDCAAPMLYSEIMWRWLFKQARK